MSDHDTPTTPQRISAQTDVEPVAWQWSDFSGNWYTVDTNLSRVSRSQQEGIAIACAASHEGRVRPLYPTSALEAVTAERDDLALDLGIRKTIIRNIHAALGLPNNTGAYAAIDVLEAQALAAESERDALKAQLVEARKALEQSMTAIDDWLHDYAADSCKPKRVAEARERIYHSGKLAYIARVQEINRDAMARTVLNHLGAEE